MPHSNPLVQSTSNRVAGYLDDIRALFKPSALVTLIVRFDGHDDRDMVLTSDDPDQAIAALQRAKERRGKPDQEGSAMAETVGGRGAQHQAEA